MKEKIIEMLKMQEALDNSFLQYMGNDNLDIEKVRMALFDELGEVNHEMKAEWCYWKKSQKPVNRDKLKEELSDVYHFSLTLFRLRFGFKQNLNTLRLMKENYNKYNWFDVIENIVKCDDNELYLCIILTEKLGFTFDEMYQAYIEKNKENYERMKRGY